MVYVKDEVEVVTALEDWGRVCAAMELLLFTQEHTTKQQYYFLYFGCSILSWSIISGQTISSSLNQFSKDIKQTLL